MTPDSFSKQPVLIIDDDPRVIEILFQALEKEGFQPEGAESAGDGYIKYIKKDFKVLLVDEALYTIDGLRLIRLIRLVDNDSTLLMISGVADLPTAVSALRIGADDYISKPFKLWDLRDRIVTSINRRAIVAKKRKEDKKEYPKGDSDRNFLFETAQSIDPKVKNHLKILIPEIEKKVIKREGFADKVKNITLEAGKRLGISDEDLKILGITAELQLIGFGVQDPHKVREALHKPENWYYNWRSFAIEGAELINEMGEETKKCADLLVSASRINETRDPKTKGLLEQVLWLGTTIAGLFALNGAGDYQDLNKTLKDFLQGKNGGEKVINYSFDPDVTMAFLQPPD